MHALKNSRIAILGLFTVLLLSGCASEVIKQPATAFEPAPDSPPVFKTVQTTVFPEFSSGYKRAIQHGSVWKLAGTVSQGEVYAPVKTAFTVQGAHSHEAYLIVDKGKLVGFYLPVEKAYSPLMNPEIKLW